MTRNTIGQNTGQSGRVNLSDSKIAQFNTEIGDPIKIDFAESKGIAKSIIENSAKDELPVSKQATTSSFMEDSNE